MAWCASRVLLGSRFLMTRDQVRVCCHELDVSLQLEKEPPLILIVSTVISGINWTVNDIQTKSRIGKATALLAVGGSLSAALNSAVASASNAGVMFAVAAGGENTNAGNNSPASEPSACTVGASTIADARASSSNYGSAGKSAY